MLLSVPTVETVVGEEEEESGAHTTTIIRRTAPAPSRRLLRLLRHLLPYLLLNSETEEGMKFEAIFWVCLLGEDCTTLP
jgi:hypothetical protein